VTKDRLLRHVLITFAIAVALYAVFYSAIEHRRVRQGPWHVTFTTNTAGAPAIVINQPALAITNVQIAFSGQPIPANPGATLTFDQPRQFPYDVPYGKVIFMDTTFLPGSVVLNLFGHEIELLPRTLIIDQEEHPWQSHSVIEPGRIETQPK
jgi:hypothetical protein